MPRVEQSNMQQGLAVAAGHLRVQNAPEMLLESRLNPLCCLRGLQGFDPCKVSRTVVTLFFLSSSEGYRYAAQGLRHAFLPAIVSTSGRIHGELLRLLFNLADKKTSNSLAALGEAIDVESEVYCRRRSGDFWRMRAALGLACAQAATLGTQVVGRPRSRPRYAARPRH